MMGWAAEQWHWVSKMNTPTFYICKDAPNDVVRAEIDNFSEEMDPDHSHLDIMLKFAKANGGSPNRIRKSEGLPTTRSSEAHALFLKAQALFSQGDTAMAVTTSPSVRASIQTLLDRVLALDPEFAPPYAIKALLYAISWIYDPVSQDGWTAFRTQLDEAVSQNAERALELSPTLGMPYFALALNHQFNWRWREARADYERAVDLKPNDSYILSWYAALEWLTDELDGALRLTRRSYALDPANAWANLILGCVLHAKQDHEGAIAVYAEFSASHPESSLPYLHRVLPEIALGHEAEALEALELASRLMPLEAAPAIHLHLAYLYRRLGRADEASKLVETRSGLFSERFVDPVIWVMGGLARGDREAALAALAEAVETPESRQEVFVRDFVMRNAWHDPVLDEPEFQALRGRLKPEA